MKWFASEKKKPRVGKTVILCFEGDMSFCCAEYLRYLGLFYTEKSECVFPGPDLFWMYLHKPSEKKRKYRRLRCIN